ncbi:hypothetical protein FACS1894170_06990 [Planctomycetales bacterium]|nr:hypothetical protein FACS1894170_06990 [Planctomycetales bacterium]
MIYELAGIIGIDPGKYTLRTLIWMAEGKQSADWNRTSHLLALLININRDTKKSRVVKPAELNPFAVKKKEKPDFYISAAQLGKVIGGKKDC